MNNKNKPIIFNGFIDNNCKVDAEIFYPLISVVITNNTNTVILRFENINVLNNFFGKLKNTIIEANGNAEAMKDTVLEE